MEVGKTKSLLCFPLSHPGYIFGDTGCNGIYVLNTRVRVVYGGAFLGDGADSRGTFWEYLAHGAPLGLCGTLGRTGLRVTEKTPMQNDVKSLL